MTVVMYGMLSGAVSLFVGILTAEAGRYSGLPWDWASVAGLLMMGTTFTILRPPAKKEIR